MTQEKYKGLLARLNGSKTFNETIQVNKGDQKIYTKRPFTAAHLNGSW